MCRSVRLTYLSDVDKMLSVQLADLTAVPCKVKFSFDLLDNLNEQQVPP
jgi:hypothetical protein